MEKQLNDLSFNYMRIKGVDCKLIENKYVGMIDNIKYNIDNEHHINGQIGCLLSHIKCFLQIINDNVDIGIIMEDDISFKYIGLWADNFDNIIKNAPSDWEIIKLHCSFPKIISYFILKYENTGIKYIKNNNMENNTSTCLYIVNRKYINNFLERYYKNNELNIKGNIAADYLLYNNFNVYNYTIPLVISNCNISIIINKHNKFDIKSNKIIINYYNKKLI
jgi:GR25 family glycosyltransferase involved in LPS biosynthesis